MPKRVLLLLFVLAGSVVNSQRKIAPTNAFRIFGKVKQEKSFNVAELTAFPKKSIKDIIIYNHKGEVKDTIKNLKGVLLTDVLASTTFVYEKPKTLNEFSQF